MSGWTGTVRHRHNLQLVGGVSRLEDVLGSLASACTQPAVGEVLAAVARSEGYENIVLARFVNGALVDIPWLSAPVGFAQTYLAEGWMHADPVLREALHSRLPFAWEDVVAQRPLSDGQRQMMEAAQSQGVHTGLTIPLHGPGSKCDLISLSQRQKTGSADPAARNRLMMIALQSLMRFLELEPGDPAAGNNATPGGSKPAAPVQLRPGIAELISSKAGSPFVLLPAHLRALVLVEAGVRRWRMGLTELGGRIYLQRKTDEIADLERWGLVVDVPDDERWRYYLAPSVLGLTYLRNSREVENLRREVWDREIDRREVPDSAQNE